MGDHPTLGPRLLLRRLEVAGGDGGPRPKGRAGDGGARQSHARRVISTFGFVEWSSLTLATLYLFFLVVYTVIRLV